MFQYILRAFMLPFSFIWRLQQIDMATVWFWKVDSVMSDNVLQRINADLNMLFSNLRVILMVWYNHLFFALCNMSRSRELVLNDLMNSEFTIQTMRRLANVNSDLNLIGELAWLLTYVTTEEENCSFFVNKGILQHLVHWLCKVRPHQQEYLFAVTPLLRCLGKKNIQFVLFVFCLLLLLFWKYFLRPRTSTFWLYIH